MRRMWTAIAAACLAVALAAGWMVTGPLAAGAASRYAADALTRPAVQQRVHDELMARVDLALTDLARSDAVQTTSDLLTGALAACQDILGMFGESWADQLGEQCREVGDEARRGVEDVAASVRDVFDRAAWNLVRSPEVQAQLAEQVGQLHRQLLDGEDPEVSLGALRGLVDQLLAAGDVDPLLREVADGVLGFPGLDRPITLDVAGDGDVPRLWQAGTALRIVAVLAAIAAVGALVAVATTSEGARRRHVGAAIGVGGGLAVLLVAGLVAWLLVGLPEFLGLVGRAAVLSGLWRGVVVAVALAVTAAVLLWTGRTRPQPGVVLSTWPAGWYRDGQSSRLRWWDGARWTEHHRELPI